MKNQHIQDSFAALDAAGGHHTEVDRLVDLSTMSGGRAAATKKTCVDDTMNCIDAELLAMLAAWEECEITRKKFALAEGPATKTTSNHECVPSCTQTFAPPKRFFITFWRSITRRMVAQTNKSIDSDKNFSVASGICCKI